MSLTDISKAINYNVANKNSNHLYTECRTSVALQLEGRKHQDNHSTFSGNAIVKMTDAEIVSQFDPLRPYLPPSLRDSLSSDFQFNNGLAILDHIRSLRSVLSTYLPQYLVVRRSKNPWSGRMEGEFRHGSVMFADVSGFTAMSEKLSVLGKEGAEEMTGIVNDYFDSMLAISDRYAGDLLKFGGDALLLFFEGSEGSMRALTVAQAMQNAMDKYKGLKTSQGVFTLRMSIGIGSGDLFLTTLGSEEEMNYAVMGRALASMARAEDRAEAGQIVVDLPTRDATLSLAAYSARGNQLWLFESALFTEIKAEQIDTKSETNAYSPPSSLSEIVENSLLEFAAFDALRPFVPDELVKRLIPDPERPMLYGSHRLVTVMFVNFYGVEKLIQALGREHVKVITEILNIYFVEMSVIISRYGGTISRVDSYVVGQRILALFGALRAHEDDPQRAIRAGLEMNMGLEKVNRRVAERILDLGIELDDASIKQRIGINSGFVFAANVGSTNRREFTVMGDQVNITARLMSVSREGEILIGQTTAKIVEAKFELNEREPAKLKGISEALRIYSVHRPKEQTKESRQSTSTPLIGRKRELAIAHEAIQSSLLAKGQILIISGVSGIGKTRLLEEIIAYGTGIEMELLLGTSLSYGRTLTYHPWAEILRTYFHILPSDEPLTRVKALEKGMQAIGERDWAPVIGTVLGLNIPDNDLTRDLDAKLRRQRVLDLMVKLLQFRAQAQPLMLILEDAHWADSASMELINYMSRNILDQPILMVLAYRPDDGLPDWKAQTNATEILLQEMSDEPSLAIIQGMIGPIQVPTFIQDLILTKAGGNPFFIGELVRSLMDSSVLEQDSSGTWQFNEEDISVNLPDTVHGVIISRIDRLDEHDRNILQAASVIGRVFPGQTLMGVQSLNDKDENLHSRLRHMAGLGLIEHADMEAGDYRFIHLTTREVVYESMAFGLRRDLHSQIGEFIEFTYSDSLREQINMLAYHYFQGQSWSKALDYNLQSGEHAQTEFANDIAIASLTNALEAAEMLEDEKRTAQARESAYESLGEVLILVGRYEEALESYGSAREIVELEEDQTPHLAALYRKTAEVYERQSKYETAFAWLDKGLAITTEDRSSLEAARIYQMGAGIYNRQAKNEEAVRWCQKTLETASKIHSRESQHVIAHTLYLQCGAQNRLGQFEDALRSCEESLRIYEQIDDFLGQSRAYNNLSVVYSDLGDWSGAGDAAHKSLAINQRIGNIQEQGFVANNLGNIHQYQGDWDGAIDLYQESNAIWKKIGAPLPNAVTLSNMAQVYIYQEHLDDARESLKQAQAIFEGIGSEDFLPELERRWAEYYLQKGDPQSALENIQRSIELATEIETRLELGMSKRVLGEVEAALGHHESAKEALEDSLQILTELESEYEAAITKLALARLEILSKNGDGEIENLTEAIATFKRIGAHAYLEKARALR